MREWLALCGLMVFTAAAGWAAEWPQAISDAEAAAITTAARENLTAILQRRPPRERETAALAPLAKKKNGISLCLLNAGRLVAAGEALDAELPANIRQAASKAVYNLPLENIDKIAIFVAVLGEGKPVRPTMAPFHPMQAGAEAYAASYQGQQGFVGPLEPLAQGWGWRETLLELARRAVSAKNPGISRGALIQTAAANDFSLTVYPVTILVSPAKAEPCLPFSSGRSDAAGRVVDAAALRQSLLDVAQWYRNNQSPDGALPLRLRGTVTADAKTADEEDLTVVAHSAYALGELWHVLNVPQVRLCGLAVLDNLLINHYLESPKQDLGYIKQKNGIPLGASALTLLAIRNLDATKNNPDLTRSAERLSSFVLQMRNPDGSFRPWLQPPDETEGARVFAAMAISALVGWDAEKNSARMLESTERYRLTYTTVSGAQPPAYAINWLTGAAARVYGTTRRNVYAEWVLGMNSAFANDWLTKHKIMSSEENAAADAALVLGSVSEALYLQKILLGQSGAEGKIRLNLYRRTVLDALRTLLALQVRDGALMLLLPEPKKYYGAFRSSSGELECSLRDISFATAALCRALSVLEAEDYLPEK